MRSPQSSRQRRKYSVAAWSRLPLTQLVAFIMRVYLGLLQGSERIVTFAPTAALRMPRRGPAPASQQ